MRVFISQPFNLNLDDGTSRRFEAGPAEISEKEAAHWYVKAHLGEAALVDPLAAEREALARSQAELEARHSQLAESARSLAAEREAFEAEKAAAKAAASAPPPAPPAPAPAPAAKPAAAPAAAAPAPAAAKAAAKA